MIYSTTFTQEITEKLYAPAEESLYNYAMLMIALLLLLLRTDLYYLLGIFRSFHL